MKGIDVSEHNGFINWQAVADAGYEFAIIRCTYGRSGEDERFVENVNGAHAAGLRVGAYHYSYALGVEDACREALHCKHVIDTAGVLLDLPVFFDMEDADRYKADHDFAFDAEEITDICREFINNINLKCGVYASLSWLIDYIDWRSLGCPVWNAQWGDEDDFEGMIWQYTDKEYIPGASAGEHFDANIMYE